MTDRVLIVDFGSQVTQLIARRVREMGVYCEIHPFNKVTVESIEYFGPQGVILSGGPASVHHMDTPRAPDSLFEMGLPVLGICYGEQTMCAQLGAKVAPSNEREFGRAFVEVTEDCALFDGVWSLGQKHQVWMSHGDRIDDLPADFKSIAATENSPIAAMGSPNNIFGIQFHPEVVHTPQGSEILKNFIYKICKFSSFLWKSSNMY